MAERAGPAATSTWCHSDRCCPPRNPATANANLYRPLQGYGDLNFATNNLYQNYNAMQVSWIRHAGMYTIQANYTWQKAMGIISPNIDPFNLSSNYGALPANRGQLFNAAYSIDLGNAVPLKRVREWSSATGGSSPASRSWKAEPTLLMVATALAAMLSTATTTHPTPA